MPRGSWMSTLHLIVVGAILTATIACTGQAEPTWPTPEITQIEPLDTPHAVAYMMRSELGDSGLVIGLTVVCGLGDSAPFEVTTFFGAFPGTHHPVQLAVRGADGTGERFGAVVAGGRESGFHSPQLTDPQDAERFVRIALRPGALISNGYRSFWNRASAERNRERCERSS